MKLTPTLMFAGCLAASALLLLLTQMLGGGSPVRINERDLVIPGKPDDGVQVPALLASGPVVGPADPHPVTNPFNPGRRDVVNPKTTLGPPPPPSLDLPLPPPLP